MIIDKENLNKVKNCLHDSGINIYMQDLDDLLTEGNRDIYNGKTYKVEKEFNHKIVTFNMEIGEEISEFDEEKKVGTKPHCCSMTIDENEYEFN